MPTEGKPLRKMFPGFDPKAMAENLNRAGAPYGILFNPFETASNSRLALQAGAFARDTGKFDEADDRLFRAYFQEGLNIGDKSIVLRLLREVGLDEGSLGNALDNDVYAAELEQTRKRALQLKIIALPTFIIDGGDKIVGAQPYGAFTRCLNAHL